MDIQYKDTKTFTPQALEDLFCSLDWMSGKYPERLAKAIEHSATVFSAWADGRLVGLINALDDGELTAYVHYLLVRPEFQGKGIGRGLVERMKERYKGYLYLLLVSENDQSAAFYHKLGFSTPPEASVMQIITEA